MEILGPKEDDPIWQSNNPQEPEEPEDPTCDQCGQPSEELIERGRRLICRKCDDDNRADAEEVQHGEE